MMKQANRVNDYIDLLKQRKQEHADYCICNVEKIQKLPFKKISPMQVQDMLHEGKVTYDYIYHDEIHLEAGEVFTDGKYRYLEV